MISFETLSDAQCWFIMTFPLLITSLASEFVFVTNNTLSGRMHLFFCSRNLNWEMLANLSWKLMGWILNNFRDREVAQINFEFLERRFHIISSK